MNTIISGLLQAALSVLLVVQQHPNAPQVTQQQAIAIAGQTIEIATEMQANTVFPGKTNIGIWTTTNDLEGALYLDTNGKYVPNNSSVGLLEGDTSFGDLNGDGYDDAATIVQRTDANGNTTMALAAILNFGKTMFNVADLTLGKNVQVFSHHILSGSVIEFDMQIDAGPRTTYHYQLVGNKLVLLP
jgi:hypothetical protein